jgi:hypothetical protein
MTRAVTDGEKYLLLANCYIKMAYADGGAAMEGRLERISVTAVATDQIIASII